MLLKYFSGSVILLPTNDLSRGLVLVNRASCILLTSFEFSIKYTKYMRIGTRYKRTNNHRVTNDLVYIKYRQVHGSIKGNDDNDA